MYESAVSYALSHLLLKDELLHNAQFVNIRERVQDNFIQVTYFVEHFSKLLPYTDLKSQELLFSRFAEFQTMQDSTIPAHTWNDAKVLEKLEGDEVAEYHRMDVLWAYLGSVKDVVTSHPQFSLLANVAKLVLTLSHSNADEERVFSLIRQNKTDFRSALSLDGTLASILTVKMASEEPCYKYEPSGEVSKCSKKQLGNTTKNTARSSIFLVYHFLAMYIFLTFQDYFIFELDLPSRI